MSLLIFSVSSVNCLCARYQIDNGNTIVAFRGNPRSIKLHNVD
ncbi:hypothetical protein [Aquimarina sp. 2201CG14-23]|nr:hypothetical protein [Aquimarina sp. 2201CG14-23]